MHAHSRRAKKNGVMKTHRELISTHQLFRSEIPGLPRALCKHACEITLRFAISWGASKTHDPQAKQRNNNLFFFIALRMRISVLSSTGLGIGISLAPCLSVGSRFYVRFLAPRCSGSGDTPITRNWPMSIWYHSCAWGGWNDTTRFRRDLEEISRATLRFFFSYIELVPRWQ